jgi:hypothetical protein
VQASHHPLELGKACSLNQASLGVILTSSHPDSCLNSLPSTAGKMDR